MRTASSPAAVPCKFSTTTTAVACLLVCLVAGCASSPEVRALRARTSEQCVRVSLHAFDRDIGASAESSDASRLAARLPPRAAFLNEASSAAAPQLTVRSELVKRWRSDERLDDAESAEDARRIALLFGDGGRYRPQDLQLREALLDLLQARVWVMSQDLALLLRIVVNPARGRSSAP